jgi:septal ring factor EnvC (AmiA/AmiB activator)
MKKIETIDTERLALAIEQYRQVIADREAHNSALLALNARCEELDSEIMDIEHEINRKTDLSKLSIAEIKSHADNKSRLKNQITALVEVRSVIEKDIKEMRSNETGMIYLDTDTKKGIWRVIYEGLLASFNTDPLEQLVVAGFMIGKSQSKVFNEIAFDESKQVERIDAMVKQFGIPE